VVPEVQDIPTRSSIPGQTGIIVTASEARLEPPEFNRFAPLLWLVASPAYTALGMLFILGLFLPAMRALAFFVMGYLLQRTPPSVPTYYYRLADEGGQAFSMRIKGPFGGLLDRGDRVTVSGVNRNGTLDAARVVNHTDGSVVTTQRLKAERLTLFKIAMWCGVWTLLLTLSPR